MKIRDKWPYRRWLWARPVVLSALALLEVSFLRAQTPTDVPNKTEQEGDVVTDRPFAAVSVAKRVRHGADGKEIFVRYERPYYLLERDGAGRIRIEIDSKEAPLTELPVVMPAPASDYWVIEVFDPAQRLTTHWGEGPIAEGKESATQELTQDQMETLAKQTVQMPALEWAPPEGAKDITEEDLGVQEIAGIQASGKRITARYNIEGVTPGAEKTLIHEVWVSTEMHLVMRVVEGDPQGEEVICELEAKEHPYSSRDMQSPVGRAEQRWHTESLRYAYPQCMEALSYWFVETGRGVTE